MSAGGRRTLAALVALSALAAAVGAARVTPGRAQESSPPPRATAASPDTDELRARAAAFWAARVAGDAKAQWELVEPRGRGRMTPSEYTAGRGAVKYLAYQVEDATVDGYFATVKVRLLVQVLASPAAQQRRKIPPSSALVNDRWVRVEGVWYRSLDQLEMESGSQ